MVLRCAWGTCNTSVWYARKLKAEGATLIPFPKPKISLKKCLRWIKACGRPHSQLNVDNIDKNKAVCSKHFVGGCGPTEAYPDPVSADGKEMRQSHPPLNRKADCTVQLTMDEKRMGTFGPITRNLCTLFGLYLKNGNLPTHEQLKEAKFAKTDSNLESYPLQLFLFKSWSKRLELNENGNLIHKRTGKPLVPEEETRNAVLYVHAQGYCRGRDHLGFMDTCNEYSTRYTMDGRCFGVGQKQLKAILRECPSPTCKLRSYFNRVENKGKPPDSMQEEVSTDNGSSDEYGSLCPSSNVVQYTFTVKKEATELKCDRQLDCTEEELQEENQSATNSQVVAASLNGSSSPRPLCIDLDYKTGVETDSSNLGVTEPITIKDLKSAKLERHCARLKRKLSQSQLWNEPRPSSNPKLNQSTEENIKEQQNNGESDSEASNKSCPSEVALDEAAAINLVSSSESEESEDEGLNISAACPLFKGENILRSLIRDISPVSDNVNEVTSQQSEVSTPALSNVSSPALSNVDSYNPFVMGSSSLESVQTANDDNFMSDVNCDEAIELKERCEANLSEEVLSMTKSMFSRSDGQILRILLEEKDKHVTPAGRNQTNAVNAKQVESINEGSPEVEDSESIITSMLNRGNVLGTLIVDISPNKADTGYNYNAIKVDGLTPHRRDISRQNGEEAELSPPTRQRRKPVIIDYHSGSDFNKYELQESTSEFLLQGYQLSESEFHKELDNYSDTEGTVGSARHYSVDGESSSGNSDVERNENVGQQFVGQIVEPEAVESQGLTEECHSTEVNLPIQYQPIVIEPDYVRYSDINNNRVVCEDGIDLNIGDVVEAEDGYIEKSKSEISGDDSNSYSMEYADENGRDDSNIYSMENAGDKGRVDSISYSMENTDENGRDNRNIYSMKSADENDRVDSISYSMENTDENGRDDSNIYSMKNAAEIGISVTHSYMSKDMELHHSSDMPTSKQDVNQGNNLNEEHMAGRYYNFVEESSDARRKGVVELIQEIRNSEGVLKSKQCRYVVDEMKALIRRGNYCYRGLVKIRFMLDATHNIIMRHNNEKVKVLDIEEKSELETLVKLIRLVDTLIREVEKERALFNSVESSTSDQIRESLISNSNGKDKLERCASTLSCDASTTEGSKSDQSTSISGRLSCIESLSDNETGNDKLERCASTLSCDASTEGENSLRTEEQNSNDDSFIQKVRFKFRKVLEKLDNKVSKKRFRWSKHENQSETENTYLPRHIENETVAAEGYKKGDKDASPLSENCNVEEASGSVHFALDEAQYKGGCLTADDEVSCHTANNKASDLTSDDTTYINCNTNDKVVEHTTDDKFNYNTTSNNLIRLCRVCKNEILSFSPDHVEFCRSCSTMAHSFVALNVAMTSVPREALCRGTCGMQTYANRVRVRACRYCLVQKCIQMGLVQRVEDNIKPTVCNSRHYEKCAVCLLNISIVSECFGAKVCSSCATFFISNCLKELKCKFSGYSHFSGNCALRNYTEAEFCRYCHLKRCFQAGMAAEFYDQFKKKVVIVDKMIEDEKICRVCGEIGTSLSSICGPGICHPCHDFFMKHYSKKELLRCKGKKGSCSLQLAEYGCKLCKMRRCIGVGMKPAETSENDKNEYVSCFTKTGENEENDNVNCFTETGENNVNDNASCRTETGENDVNGYVSCLTETGEHDENENVICHTETGENDVNGNVSCLTETGEHDENENVICHTETVENDVNDKVSCLTETGEHDENDNVICRTETGDKDENVEGLTIDYRVDTTHPDCGAAYARYSGQIMKKSSLIRVCKICNYEVKSNSLDRFQFCWSCFRIAYMFVKKQNGNMTNVRKSCKGMCDPFVLWKGVVVCEYCCLLKCINVGLVKLIEDRLEYRILKKSDKCKVCHGKPGVSQRFAVKVCRRCATFFQTNCLEELKCILSSGNCILRKYYDMEFCRYCHLKRCFQAGMAAEFYDQVKNRFVVVDKMITSIWKRCWVCGEIESSVTYSCGVYACRSCSVFFVVNFANEDGLKCNAEGKCYVKRGPEGCKSCRLDRCFDMGMTYEIPAHAASAGMTEDVSSKQGRAQQINDASAASSNNSLPQSQLSNGSVSSLPSQQTQLSSVRRSISFTDVDVPSSEISPRIPPLRTSFSFTDSEMNGLSDRHEDPVPFIVVNNKISTISEARRISDNELHHLTDRHEDQVPFIVDNNRISTRNITDVSGKLQCDELDIESNDRSKLQCDELGIESDHDGNAALLPRNDKFYPRYDPMNVIYFSSDEGDDIQAGRTKRKSIEDEETAFHLVGTIPEMINANNSNRAWSRNFLPEKGGMLLRSETRFAADDEKNVHIQKKRAKMKGKKERNDSKSNSKYQDTDDKYEKSPDKGRSGDAEMESIYSDGLELRKVDEYSEDEMTHIDDSEQESIASRSKKRKRNKIISSMKHMLSAKELPWLPPGESSQKSAVQIDVGQAVQIHLGDESKEKDDSDGTRSSKKCKVDFGPVFKYMESKLRSSAKSSHKSIQSVCSNTQEIPEREYNGNKQEIYYSHSKSRKSKTQEVLDAEPGTSYERKSSKRPKKQIKEKLPSSMFSPLKCKLSIPDINKTSTLSSLLSQSALLQKNTTQPQEVDAMHLSSLIGKGFREASINKRVLKRNGPKLTISSQPEKVLIRDVPDKEVLVRIINSNTVRRVMVPQDPQIIRIVQPHLVSVTSPQQKLAPSVTFSLRKLEPSVTSSQRKLASLVTSSQQKLAPSVTTSQQKLAPSVTSSQQKLAPSVTTSQQKLAPSVTSSQQKLAPSVTASQQKLAPSVTCLQQKLAPSVTSSLRKLSPSVTSSLRKLAPSITSSQQKLAPSVTSSQRQLKTVTSSRQNPASVTSWRWTPATATSSQQDQPSVTSSQQQLENVTSSQQHSLPVTSATGGVVEQTLVQVVNSHLAEDLALRKQPRRRYNIIHSPPIDDASKGKYNITYSPATDVATKGKYNIIRSPTDNASREKIEKQIHTEEDLISAQAQGRDNSVVYSTATNDTSNGVMETQIKSLDTVRFTAPGNQILRSVPCYSNKMVSSINTSVANTLPYSIRPNVAQSVSSNRNVPLSGNQSSLVYLQKCLTSNASGLSQKYVPYGTPRLTRIERTDDRHIVSTNPSTGVSGSVELSPAGNHGVPWRCVIDNKKGRITYLSPDGSKIVRKETLHPGERLHNNGLAVSATSEQNEKEDVINGESVCIEADHDNSSSSIELEVPSVDMRKSREASLRQEETAAVAVTPIGQPMPYYLPREAGAAYPLIRRQERVLGSGWCAVCGAKAYRSRLYGVYCCKACHKFLRSIRAGNKVMSTCVDEQENCVVDKDSRSRCRFCRYMKCLSVGLGRRDDDLKPEDATEPDSTSPENTHPVNDLHNSPSSTHPVRGLHNSPSSTHQVRDLHNSPSSTHPVRDLHNSPSSTPPVRDLHNSPSSTHPVSDLHNSDSSTPPVRDLLYSPSIPNRQSENDGNGEKDDDKQHCETVMIDAPSKVYSRMVRVIQSMDREIKKSMLYPKSGPAMDRLHIKLDLTAALIEQCKIGLNTQVMEKTGEQEHPSLRIKTDSFSG